MKIQIASDLHLEFLERTHPDYQIIDETDADVLVLAGDINRDTRAIDTFNSWHIPVIYIHGNHELYHGHAYKAVEQLRSAAVGTNVHYLDDDEVILHGVRFLGCTLWTDYALDGDPAAAMASAGKGLNDHRIIRTDAGPFRPEDALHLHQRSRAWLEEKLNTPFSGKTVVVTHHGPHPNSVDPQYAGEALNPAFSSDLTPLMGKAALWIHGHTHSSVRYNVDGTEVVANPAGYPQNRNIRDPRNLEFENNRFDRKLIVEI